jgi:deoxycytidine triphosphate deaminase
MFGNLIANRQLRQLVNGGQIVISGFDDKSLKPAHYTVEPGRLFRRRDDGKWLVAHDFEAEETATLEANEYVVIELRQRVVIVTEGIVGRIITTSNHIEGGLLVVAGQIDSKYGARGEHLRVGVKNLLTVRNELKRSTRLAHIEFFDLRGITIESRVLSEVEQKIWSQRRDPSGDGPDYSMV